MTGKTYPRRRVYKGGGYTQKKEEMGREEERGETIVLPIAARKKDTGETKVFYFIYRGNPLDGMFGMKVKTPEGKEERIFIKLSPREVLVLEEIINMIKKALLKESIANLKNPRKK